RRQPHERHHFLAILPARHPHDLHLTDRRVSVQDSLDLTRIDVLTATNNHIFQATYDVDIDILIHHRQVARAHPARHVNRAARCLLIVPVTAHHGGATCAELTGHPAWQKHPCGWIAHADLDMRYDTPHRANPVFQVIISAAQGRER